jgi:putative ABC transport system substrate-binding protein
MTAAWLRRRTVLGGLVAAGAAGAAAAIAPWKSTAATATREARVGILMASSSTDTEAVMLMSAFEGELRRLGWTPGLDLQLEYRWSGADADEARSLAKELVEMRPEVLVAYSTSSLIALKEATTRIPIVFVSVGDPVGQGFVSSLPRPGGNITGFANFESRMGAKWLAEIKGMVPSLKRICLIADVDLTASYLPAARDAAGALGVELVSAPVHKEADMEAAIVAVAKQGNAGLIFPSDEFNLVRRDFIVALTAKHKLPAIYAHGAFVTSGGLMSYGVDLVDLFGQAAPYVDRILKGANPGELPVQVPSKFEILVNLRTAKALDINVPQTVLLVANEVIE